MNNLDTDFTKELQTALETAIERETASVVQINQLRPLPGGASRETWQVDLVVAAGSWRGEYPLILQRQRFGPVKITSTVLGLATQFAVLSAAYSSGVPVPRPFWFWPDVLGSPAMLAQRLAGETVGRRVVKLPNLAAARTRLPAQMGQALAAIHAIDLEAHHLRASLPQPDPDQTPAQLFISQAETNLDQLDEPHPALELALRWLRRNEPPPPDRLVLLHGDYRLGNVMVDEHGLAGILDWEFAHIGDPAQDLGWPLVRAWRFKVDQLRFGGVAPAEPFLEAYNQAGGCSISPERLFYWEVAGNVLWAVVTLNQARRYLSGQELDLEFASLGRVCAEVELEILRLMAQD
jgi:aminoglycoside phosphotransferase (APT) family kinase protein